jgi:hypothetical protein
MNRKIPINRNRIPALLIVGLLLSIGFGHAIFFPDNTLIVGPANRIFFALVLPVLLFYVVISFADFMKTRFDKNAGFELTEIGVFDNLSIFSCGEICWSDISTVEITKMHEVHVLVIKLHDPHKYLTGKNAIKRYILKKYIKKWGSPIVVSEKRVNYDLNELKETILACLPSKLA